METVKVQFFVVEMFAHLRNTVPTLYRPRPGETALAFREIAREH